MDNSDKSKEQQLQKINELQVKIVELEIIETKQKEIQKELRSINQQLRISENKLIKEKEFSENLLETANTFILNLDTNANITLFNKFAEKLTGYKKEEVLGKNWFDIFIPKSDESTILDVFSSVLKEMPEFSSYENPILCKTGFERLISWENTVLKDDNKKISGMLSIGTDITERKIVEEELSIKNEVFNASITANSTSDNEGILTYVNDAFIKVFGCKNNKEAIGKPISDFFKFENEAINIIKVLNESGIWKGEYTGLRKDGTTFSAHGLATIIKDNQGNRIGYQSVVQDITERKQAETKLLKNQYYLTKAQEIGSIGTWEIDILKNILIWTDENYKIFGVPLETEMNLELFIDCVHPDDRDYVIEKWNAGLNQDPYDIEHRIIVDDKVKWVREKADIDFNIEGKPIMAIGFTQDITERKQAEEDLKNSEIKFRALYDNAPLSYQSLDKDGCFLDVNPTWLSTLGYEREDVIGKSFTEFLHPDNKSYFEKNFTEFKKHGYVHGVQYKLRHKDGHYIDISFEGCVGYHSDGSFKQTYCVFQDITERKQAEETLRIERDNMRSIFEAMEDGIYLTDQHFNIQYVNPVLEKDFGNYKDKKCYEYFHDRTKVCPWCKNAEVFTGKTVRWEWFSSKNGKTYDLIDTPLKNPDGSISKLEIFRDITERKEAEEALRSSEEKFKALYDNAPLSYQSLDEDGNFRDVNPTWLKTLGYKKEEVIGKKYADFLHPDYQEHFEKSFPTFKKRGYVHDVQFKIRHKDGTYLDISFEGCIGYHPDGSFKETYCVFQDITERKLAEEALRSSEEKFRNMTEQINEVIFLTDDKGKLDYISPASTSIFGYTPQQMEGRLFMKFLKKTEIPKAMKRFLKTITSGSPTIDMNLKMIHKSKEIFIGELSARIFKTENYKGTIGVIRDITEQQKSKEALKESEEKYRFITTNTLDTIWTADLKLNMTFVNSAIFNFLGYTPEEFIDLNPTDFTTPEGIKIIQNAVEQLIAKYKEGEIIQSRFELQQIRKDGTLIDVEIRSNLLLDSEGEIIGFQGRSIDITKRKQTEETLHNSEERLKILFDSAPDAYYINDLKGNFVDGNKAAEELMGYKREELIGKNFLNLKLLSAKDLPKVSKLLLKNIQGKGTGPDEICLNRKDGSQVLTEILSYPVKIKNKTFVLGIARDITKRKQAEEALRESEELSTKLIASVPDIIIRTDINGNIVFCNEALLTLFPTITFEDLLGKNMLSFFKEEDRSRAEENTKLMFERSLGIKEYQIQFADVNYDFEINGEVLRDSSSKPIGMVYILRDITDRKLAEENIKKRNEELEVFNKMTVGRELKMIELKKEINNLLEKAGEKPVYEIVE